LPENKQTKKNGGNFMAKEYYLYVRGQKVKVREDIYKVYWQEKEHEKYLEQVDKKNHLLFFFIIGSCGVHSVDTKSEIVKILYFKQFYKHYVFNEDGDGGRKKVLKNYIDVYVCIDMVCGDTRNELESEGY